MKTFVFIGAGPTTLGATYRIHELIREGKLSQDEVCVRVVEREAVPGGLARSIVDDNKFAWDLGVHIHADPSKYQCFTKCIEEAVSDWNFIRRSVKADMGHLFKADADNNNTNPYLPYPVQQAVPMFPPAIRDACMNELRQIQATKFDEPPKNFGEWTYRAFGQTLQDVFVRPYNRKVWTVDLEEMNSTWVGERVALVNVKELEEMSKKTREELEKEDLGWGPNAWFRYPKHLTGCGFTWKRVTELQPADWFKFNEDAVRIDPTNKTLTSKHVHDGTEHTYKYDYLLSTIPITLLGSITGIAPHIQLEHSKVALVGLGLKMPQPPFYSTVSWTYHPSPDLVFYRCTFLSNFNDAMTPDSTKFWSVIVEIGMRPEQHVDERQLVADTIKGLMSRKVFENEDQVVDKFFKLLNYGYPIPTVNRDAELKKAHAALEPFSIYSRGRFGGWRYEVANQDHSFAQGYEWVDHMINGTKETVYEL